MHPLAKQLDQAIAQWAHPALADPQSRAAVRNDWPLHRIDQALAIAAAYLIFVFVASRLAGAGSQDGTAKPGKTGKKKYRSVCTKFQQGPLLFLAMAIYNACQVALCGWMVRETIVQYQQRGFKLVCNEFNAKEEGIAFVLHVFYLSKVLDFLDTLFIIIKRDWRRLSFLHVYHHSSIFLIYWLNTNVGYDGDIYLTVVLNGTIHFIMYGYYLLTTFNVPVPAPIKLMVTNAQLIQFVTMISQGSYLVLNNCEFPRNVTFMYIIYIMTMLALFLQFRFNKANYQNNVPSEKPQREHQD